MVQHGTSTAVTGIPACALYCIAEDWCAGLRWLDIAGIVGRCEDFSALGRRIRARRIVCSAARGNHMVVVIAMQAAALRLAGPAAAGLASVCIVSYFCPITQEGGRPLYTHLASSTRTRGDWPSYSTKMFLQRTLALLLLLGLARAATKLGGSCGSPPPECQQYARLFLPLYKKRDAWSSAGGITAAIAEEMRADAMKGAGAIVSISSGVA